MNRFMLTKQWLTKLQHILISVRLPENHWAGDSTRQFPHIKITIDEHMPLPKGRGSAIGRIYGRDLSRIRSTLEEHQGIESISFFGQNDECLEFNIVVSRGGGGFVRPLIEAEVVPQTPFSVSDGWVEWEFSTDRQHVKELVGLLKNSGLPHKIHSLTKEVTERLLTPRQREVLDLAIESGFYDSPRKITLTSLADISGVSKSTLCEMVQLIENHIVHEYLGDIRRRSPKEKKIHSNNVTKSD